MMRVNVRRVIQSPRMVQTYQVTRTSVAGSGEVL